MKKNNSFPFPNKEDSYNIYINDPCYKKIEKDQRITVYKEAWQRGVDAAKKLKAKYKKVNIAELFKQDNVKVICKDRDYVVGNYRYFCEFVPGKKRVVANKKSIELWSKKQKMDYDEAFNIILSHEYFHLLEEKELGWTSKICLVPMLIIGKWKFGKTGIAALSEVAANAFAYELAVSKNIKALKNDKASKEK